MIDFGALFSQALSTFWWLLPNKNDDHLINNVTIPNGDGSIHTGEAFLFAPEAACL